MTPTQPRRNSEGRHSVTLQHIAELVGGELTGDPAAVITGVAGLKEAREGDISFLANDRYLPLVRKTKASALVTGPDFAGTYPNLIRTPHPSRAFTAITGLFVPSAEDRPRGVHPSACVDPTARLGRGVAVGPAAVIGPDVEIGDDTIVDSGAVVGAGCRIGAASRLYPRVTVYPGCRIGSRVFIHAGAVIGSDGFGYETISGRHEKIPHVGTVVIEDDVEIGSNTCIDRGRFRETRIGRGTKIDNLVQVAHNVHVGPDCLIVSQAGISGSAVLGRGVVLAGQVGVVGHVEIGDGAVVGARSGVPKSVPPGSVVLGEPARPIGEQKRILALIGRLPEWFKEWLEFKKRAGS